MEMLDISCPRCGAIYHSEEAHIGMQIRCTRCGYVISIAPLSKAVLVQPLPRVQSAVGRRGANRRQTALIVTTLVAIVAVSAVLLLRRSDSVQSNHAQKGTASLSDIEPTHDAALSKPDGTGWEVVGEEKSGTFDQQTRRAHAPTADPRPRDYVSLPTGTRIAENVGPNGLGKLAIKNGLDVDAVVQLCNVASRKRIRWFFMKAQSSQEEEHIPEGKYWITFMTGLNWQQNRDDPELGIFSWHPAYFQFDRALDYREQSSTTGTEYHSITVTLHPVPNGNIRKKTISRKEFLNGFGDDSYSLFTP